MLEAAHRFFEEDDHGVRQCARVEKRLGPPLMHDAVVVEPLVGIPQLLEDAFGFGMAIRAMGHGMKVGIVQFIKGAMSTGEEQFLRRFPDEVSFHAMGEGYTWETQNRERDIEKAEAAWEKGKEFLSDPTIGLVVFDELNIALKYHYLDVQKVIADLQARPEMQHVVITGRGALPELIEIADTVTEMQVVKHAFKDGIAAQAGVEW